MTPAKSVAPYALTAFAAIAVSYALAVPPQPMSPGGVTQAQYASLQSQLAAEIAARQSAVLAEVSRAQGAEQTVQAAIPSNATISALAAVAAPVQSVCGATGTVGAVDSCLGSYAKTSALTAALQTSQPVQTLASIPTSGPGAGLCKEFYVPASLTNPAGTAGTCSQIEMCGTSPTYLIKSTNVGNGC